MRGAVDGWDFKEASGVSYQTFYNKPLLKEYVEQRRNASGIDNSSEERARLCLRLNEAEERIKVLEKGDAELVLARIENDQLRERIHLLEVQLAGGVPGGMAEAKPYRSLPSDRARSLAIHMAKTVSTILLYQLIH